MESRTVWKHEKVGSSSRIWAGEDFCIRTWPAVHCWTLTPVGNDPVSLLPVQTVDGRGGCRQEGDRRQTCGPDLEPSRCSRPSGQQYVRGIWWGIISGAALTILHFYKPISKIIGKLKCIPSWIQTNYQMLKVIISYRYGNWREQSMSCLGSAVIRLKLTSHFTILSPVWSSISLPT